MRVRSKLADVEFQFGEFEYRKDHLIIHSAPEQAMQTRVYVSPDDIVSAMGRALANPRVWLYFAGFPVLPCALPAQKEKGNQELGYQGSE